MLLSGAIYALQSTVCCCCCSVSKLCPIICKLMNYSTPGFPVLHHLRVCSNSCHLIYDAIHLILCCPLLLLPSVFPSIRVFSNEAALRIRSSEYWSFSFSICPSNEYSGWISFRFDLLTVQETFKSLLQHHSSKP